MFDIGWGELIVIGIVALVVIGPKELPALLRTLGQGMAKLRQMAGEFQNQFQDAMREAELDELRKKAEQLVGDASSAASFNPIDKVASELQAAIDTPSQPEPAISAAPSASTAEVSAPSAAAVESSALPEAVPPADKEIARAAAPEEGKGA